MTKEQALLIDIKAAIRRAEAAGFYVLASNTENVFERITAETIVCGPLSDLEPFGLPPPPQEQPDE